MFFYTLSAVLVHIFYHCEIYLHCIHSCNYDSHKTVIIVLIFNLWK